MFTIGDHSVVFGSITAHCHTDCVSLIVAVYHTDCVPVSVVVSPTVSDSPASSTSLRRCDRFKSISGFLRTPRKSAPPACTDARHPAFAAFTNRLMRSDCFIHPSSELSAIISASSSSLMYWCGSISSTRRTEPRTIRLMGVCSSRPSNRMSSVVNHICFMLCTSLLQRLGRRRLE